VWIDFFNGRDSGSVRRLRELIEREEDLCISDFILTEVLQGFRRDRDFLSARKHLLRFPVFRLRERESYIGAAQIYRACRRRGLTIRKTVDCIIAQTAIENRLPLLHEDTDFDAIATVCPLKIHRSD